MHRYICIIEIKIEFSNQYINFTEVVFENNMYMSVAYWQQPDRSNTSCHG